MGENDGGIGGAHDADGAAAVFVVVGHFEILATGEVKPRADEVGSRLRFLQSQGADLRPRQCR